MINMEEQKSTSKQDKKRTQISLGGGDGIGGVVVLGGALAIAGLIAVFTIKNRRRDADKNPKKRSGVSKESKNNFSCKKEEEGSEGLRFLSQTSSLTTDYGSCLTTHGTSKMSVTQIDPCESLASAKSLILEEKPRTEIIEEREDSLSGHQETILSDYSTPESIASCDDCIIVEEYSSPALEVPILIEETMVKNDSGMEKIKSISMKTIEDEKADEASLIVHAEDKAEQEKSATQSDEEEETDDEEEGRIVEEGEESSEGTGDSSMESNAEAIWPAELIDESSQELEQTEIIFQNNLKKTEEEDKTVKLDEHDYFDNTNNGHALKNEAAEKPIMIWKETHEPVMVNNQPARSSKLGIWIFSMLLLVLLMLLLALTNHKALASSALS